MISRMRASRRGVTIIELITVIGVLTILATIGTSSFISALDSARNAQARSSLSIAMRSAVASWAERTAFPVDAVLALQLQDSLPEASVSLAASQALAPRGFYLEQFDDQTITICNASSAGNVYCVRTNQQGGLGSSNLVYAFAWGETNTDAICNLAGLGTEPGEDCSSGAPDWTGISAT